MQTRAPVRTQPAAVEDTAPHVLWSPLIAALVTLTPGLVGLATGQLLLSQVSGRARFALFPAPRARMHSGRLGRGSSERDRCVTELVDIVDHMWR